MVILFEKCQKCFSDLCGFQVFLFSLRATARVAPAVILSNYDLCSCRNHEGLDLPCFGVCDAVTAPPRRVCPPGFRSRRIGISLRSTFAGMTRSGWPPVVHAWRHKFVVAVETAPTAPKAPPQSPLERGGSTRPPWRIGARRGVYRSQRAQLAAASVPTYSLHLFPQEALARFPDGIG